MTSSGMDLTLLESIFHDAPVAQLDRVSASEAEGHWFDSSRARHLKLMKRALPPVPLTAAQLPSCDLTGKQSSTSVFVV